MVKIDMASQSASSSHSREDSTTFGLSHLDAIAEQGLQISEDAEPVVVDWMGWPRPTTAITAVPDDQSRSKRARFTAEEETLLTAWTHAASKQALTGIKVYDQLATIRPRHSPIAWHSKAKEQRRAGRPRTLPPHILQFSMSEISSHLESSQVPLGLTIKASLQDSHASSRTQDGSLFKDTSPPPQRDPADSQITHKQQVTLQDHTTRPILTGITLRIPELPGTTRLGLTTKSTVGGSWLKTQARAAWISTSSYKMLEWGASVVSPGTCVIVPQEWGDKSPRDVVQTLNLARFVQGAAVMTELNYTYDTVTVPWTAAALWFARLDEHGPLPSEEEIHRYCGGRHGSAFPLDLRRCGHRLCINPAHVVAQPPEKQILRDRCFAIARHLKKEDYPIPQYCQGCGHEPPCLLQHAAMTLSENMAAQCSRVQELLQ